MKTVGLIPLDSRPCNTNWLKSFAQTAKLKLVSYPFEKCGSLHIGASQEDMLNWLAENKSKLDYLIISADGFFSGGLVQARLGLANPTQVSSMLEVIKQIKQEFPDLKIFVFDTIMRTSITAYDSESERYWAKMNEYSRLKGRYFFFKEKEDEIKLSMLRTEIPAHIIQTYEQARNVKFQITKQLIDLVEENIIEYLLVLQEDAMPHGVQKIEQLQLEEMVQEKHLDKQVKFYNGTDEGGAILLGRIILSLSKTPYKLYLHLPSIDALHKTMPFEDRPFQTNLDLMVESFGYLTTQDVNDADFILSIYTEEEPYNLPLELFIPIVPKKDETYHKFFEEIWENVKKKRKVAFVDLLFPNGGSIDILKDLPYHELYAYSAWNTASNSLGSLLCDVASKLVTNSKSSTFLYERIIDDCLYQYDVRRHVNQECLSKAMNVYDLGKKTKDVENMIQEKLKVLSKTFKLPDFTICLPWNRTFEIDIKLED